MIGRKRTPTWTTIQSTINPGDNLFQTTEDVDWQVGEEVVIASTSFDHNEAEQRTIVEDMGNRTFRVDKDFQFQHVAIT